MAEQDEAKQREIDKWMLRSLSTWFEARAKGFKGPHSFNDWDVSFMLARRAIQMAADDLDTVEPTPPTPLSPHSTAA